MVQNYGYIWSENGNKNVMDEVVAYFTRVDRYHQWRAHTAIIPRSIRPLIAVFSRSRSGMNARANRPRYSFGLLPFMTIPAHQRELQGLEVCEQM